MSAFSPTRAALIARGVYALIDQSVSQAAAYHQDLLGCEGIFNVMDGSRFTGRSGGLYAFKRLSGFGYIAEGTGRHQGEVLVVTRGTRIIQYDWLTNLNVGLQVGPGDELVHAGFHEVWKSFSAEIAGFLRGRNPSVIHCVGHSLGGALATLNADYFSRIRAGEVKLYTFGSPRVGTAAFAANLCKRVGEQNMYRTYHCADPVPMIPLFPYWHVPLRAPGYQLGNGERGLFHPAAHGMVESYIPGVAKQGWQALQNRDLRHDRKLKIQLRLEALAADSSGIVMGGSWSLSVICQALTWLLDKAMSLACTAISCGSTLSLTALDYLAWMLGKGVQMSVDFSVHVSTFITAIFRFLGRPVLKGAALTVSFIRWMLGLLYQALATVARRALAMVS